MCLLVFDDVCGYAGRDVPCLLVLTKVLHKVALRVHQVHDDGVIHLGGEGLSFLYVTFDPVNGHTAGVCHFSVMGM